MLEGPQSSLSPQTLDRAFGTSMGAATARTGTSVRLIDGGDTITLVVPEGQTGSVNATASAYGWSLSALRFGVEMYVSVANAASSGLGTAAAGSWQHVLERLSGVADLDGYGEALRACGTGMADLTESDSADVAAAGDMLAFLWKCVPALMQADIAATGVTMFALGGVLAVVGTVTSLVLTAGHLLVTSVREVYDGGRAIRDLLTGFAGPDDPQYDIDIRGPAFGPDTRIGFEGAGPLKAGMTLREAEQATGLPFIVEGFEGFEGLCYFATPKGLDGHLSVLVLAPGQSAPADPRDGIVGRVSSYAHYPASGDDPGLPPAKTVSGIAIGDTAERVRQAYGTALTSEPHLYNEDGENLTLEPKPGVSPGLKLRIEIGGGTVQAIHGGQADVVDFPEGCA